MLEMIIDNININNEPMTMTIMRILLRKMMIFLTPPSRNTVRDSAEAMR